LTIPREVREKMRLLTLSEVEFGVERNVVVLRKVAAPEGRGKKTLSRECVDA
jgi:bifunctional DNA-binding transcriptional regulator/antitoxin component of YhaV-PrlF toxin-antitoxin module